MPFVPGTISRIEHIVPGTNGTGTNGKLEAFAADIFFDDSGANIESARQFVASGHVPHGVSNPEQ